MPKPRKRSAPSPGGITFTTPEGRLDLRGIEWKLQVLLEAVEQSPVSIVITDPAGLIQYVNPKFTQRTGYSLQEVLGRTPRILKGGDLSRAFYQDLWQTILAGREWHGIFRNRTKAGDLLWELGSISPIRGEDGTITHFVGMKEDITDLRCLQEQLDHQAHHDLLTGLPNRALFYDRIQHLLPLAQRQQAPFAVLFVDLDGFKAVNDGHGHRTGDGLLVQVGQRIQACLRQSDTVARLGGDEFAVILPEVHGRENAGKVARKIVRALAKPFQVAGVPCSVTASLGISLYPEHGEDADRLVSAADAAMYAAKSAGRNGSRFAAG